jgi:hypothetical protein
VTAGQAPDRQAPSALRTDWRSPGGAIGLEDLRLVLRACAKRPAEPYARLATDRSLAGIGLRVDLGRGLTTMAARCLDELAALALRPWVLFPPAAAGDLGYAREGELILDPQAVERLRSLCERAEVPAGILLDPSACISRVLNSPFSVWRSVRAALQGKGIELEGCGCSFRGDLRSVLDMVWAYRTAGRLARPDHWHLLGQIPFACREWLSLKDGDTFFMPPRDGVERLGFLVDDGPPTWVRALGVAADVSLVRRLDLTLDGIAFTDRAGWSLLRQGGERRAVPASEVADWIAGLPPSARMGVVIDPADVAWEAPATSAAALRPIPYPYHHYLSVNSDVDWSTHEQVERVAEHLCDELGLTLAGSAYLFSRDPRWPSWNEVPGLADGAAMGDLRVTKWAAGGLIDTMHGLAHSFDPVRIVEDAPLDTLPLVVEPDLPIDVRGLDGLLLVTAGAAATDSPVVSVLVDERRMDLRAAVLSVDAEADRCFHVYPLPAVSGSERGRLRRVEIPPAAAPMRVQYLQTLVGSTPAVADLMARLQAANVTVPVYTAHGGAEGTLALGVCPSSGWVARHPDQARQALDRRDSPFYVLPHLRERGVRFFNTLGIHGQAVPIPLEQLLVEEALQDGSRAYTFPRMLPARWQETGHSPEWTYGKDAANTQSLASNLDAILQRMHWLEPGRGGILYTHLGHRVGNQISPRLGWNEEALAAWSRVAEFVQARDRDDPVPFRVWLAPASSVLAFATVMKGLGAALERDGDEVRIRSWNDPAAGCRVPDPSRFGTSWLHGVTIHVPDPAAARVSVDGIPLTHFTRNPADALGGPSITLVDASGALPIVAGFDEHGERVVDGVRVVVATPSSPTELRTVGADGRTEWLLSLPAVPLRNATHWSFETTGVSEDGGFSFGFQTPDGAWFDAGSLGGVHWPVRLSGRGWQRWTFALDDGAGPARPRRAIVAVRIRIARGTKAAGLAFRDACVIVPRAARPLTPTRILAGTARSALDGRPVAGLTVSCRGGERRLTTKTGDEGAFAFTGLDPGARYVLDADSGLRAIHFVRGRVAHLTCDQWDFDLAVGPGPA